MELHKIDSIQALRQERLRLQQEANAARDLLHLKVQGTIDSGKKGLLGSWKAIIPLIITASIKQFASNNSSRKATVGSEENAFFATFQEGFHAFQQPGNEKWLALFPVIIRLWEQWQDHQEEKFKQAPSSANSENAALRSEEPAFS
jgi:hypothetical protein